MFTICTICQIKTKCFKCKTCDYLSCFKCNINYVNSKHQMPQCMNCHEIFDTVFIYETFPSALKMVVTQVLKKINLDKELYLLPEALNILADSERLNELKELRKLTNKSQIKKTYQLREEILEETNKCGFYHMKLCIYGKGVACNASLLQVKLHNINREYQNTIEQIDIETKLIKNKLEMEPEKYKLIKKFVKECPKTECRGFLSEEYFCSLCNSEVCKECQEIKDYKHICDANTLKNLKLIHADSKECPGCRAPIFKISGCSDFFCTICHTMFNYRTLEILTGSFHNPHYIEYLASQKKKNSNVNRILGLNVDFIENFVRKFSKIDSEIVEKLRQTVHIENVELRLLTDLKAKTLKDGLENRIKYLHKKIDIVKFSALAYNFHKTIEYSESMIILLRDYIEAITDIFYDCYFSFVSKKQSYHRGTSDIIELDETLKDNIKLLSHVYSKENGIYLHDMSMSLI